jgi:hypothetical protein
MGGQRLSKFIWCAMGIERDYKPSFCAIRHTFDQDLGCNPSVPGGGSIALSIQDILLKKVGPQGARAAPGRSTISGGSEPTVSDADLGARLYKRELFSRGPEMNLNKAKTRSTRHEEQIAQPLKMS